MESTEDIVKEFASTTSVLPFTKYGLASCSEFKKAKTEIEELEVLKRVGLTADEIKLYNDHRNNTLDKHCKLDKDLVQEKLNAISKKICDYEDSAKVSSTKAQASTSGNTTDKLIESLQKQTGTSNNYPEGHPMNNIKDLESTMFSHHNETILPLNKRRKVMRFLEKKQEFLEGQQKELISNEPKSSNDNKSSNSLWDVKCSTKANKKHVLNKNAVGPKPQAMYTIKDNQIHKLESAPENETGEREHVFIAPEMQNPSEQLIDGMKISVDDIRKMDRFKDYEPGVPSKVLYLKNLEPSVSLEQLSILFNQFVTDNGGPIDVRLMTGRMRGQAFVRFREDHVALQALEEINGIVVCGKPIIAEFGRNNIEMDDNR